MKGKGFFFFFWLIFSDVPMHDQSMLVPLGQIMIRDIHVCTWTMAWSSENSFPELVLSFHQCGSRILGNQKVLLPAELFQYSNMEY